MRICRSTTTMALLAGLLATAGAASAAQPPSAARRIPAGVAWVMLIDEPGQTATAAGQLLARFKDLVPDMDPARVGEKLEAQLGENPLTPKGMRALGLDPDGSLALYSSTFGGEPVLALPLVDAQRFLTKRAAMEQPAAEPDAPPQPAPELAPAEQRSGAAVYRFSGYDYAIKGNWCLLVPPAGLLPKGADPIRGFFGKGAKLARDKSFRHSLAGLPDDSRVAVYLSVTALRQRWQAYMQRRMAADQRRLESAKTPETKQFQRQMLAGARRLAESTDGWLAQFQGLALGMRLTGEQVEGVLFAATQPRGHQQLTQVLPAGAAPPGFHAGLLESSILGGWAAFRLPAFLDWIGPLPASPWTDIDRAIEESTASFAEHFGMDLRRDVLGNLREPVLGYLLLPDLEQLETEAPMEQQIVSLLRLLVITRVADRAKAERFLAAVDARAAKEGQAIETRRVAGAELHTVQPKPGMAISWGLKGDVLLFAFGPGAAASAAQRIDPGAFRLAAGSQQRGAARFDFSKLGQVLTKAVQRGIGGDQGTRFRMTWPLVQQVFARLGQWRVSGSLSAQGLTVRSSLGLN